MKTIKLFTIILLITTTFAVNAQTIIKGKSNQLTNVSITTGLADKTPPTIHIIEPILERGFKSTVTNQALVVKAKVSDESGITSVNINNQQAAFIGNNTFQITLNLAYGDNTISVKAIDTKNNTAFEQFKIERQEVITNNPNQIATNEILSGLGKYYALIIGNNTYLDQAIVSLNEPVNDATKLYKVLTTQYSFDAQNVTFLKNATYVQMIEAFDDLSNKITSNDNLLVFYAGHGWWDDSKNLGYWLPCDAKKANTAFWIRNSTISDYMGSIHTKHTLLIADACFSGSIFKTRNAFNDAQPAINKLYELSSRKAMTSGNLKEVPDKSVFLQYLTKRLTDNTEKYLSSDVLFASFRQAVLNNSSTEPQYGTIQNAGDEGGEFIFIKK